MKKSANAFDYKFQEIKENKCYIFILICYMIHMSISLQRTPKLDVFEKDLILPGGFRIWRNPFFFKFLSRTLIVQVIQFLERLHKGFRIFSAIINPVK